MKLFPRVHWTLASLSLGLLSASAQSTLLSERFNDGSRTNLSPTTSAAWFSSAAGNTVLTNGTPPANGSLALDNGSSRTLVGYFTPAATPAQIPVGETMTLTVNLTITGAPLAKSNGLIVGLLQSVANPSAVTGTGFTASGAPNTNARVTGDYASSNPASNVFSIYNGYAAWTNFNGTSTTLRKRNASDPGLDNASAAWTQLVSGGTGTAPVANIQYQAILSLARTATGGMNISYALKQGATTLSTLSFSETTASYTSFDTVNVYMASATLTGAGSASLVINQVDVTVTNSAVVVAPSITNTLVNQSVFTGQPASFSVAATGTAPLAYQWRKDTQPISGATTATLSFPAAQLSDTGSYDVVVTNSANSATSNAATLTVTNAPSAPVITDDPDSQTVNASGNVTFTITATGDAPLFYQWRKNTSPISGATGSTLSLTNVQSSDEAVYDVLVSNAGGTTPSASATLTVNAPPMILTPPASQAALIGGSVTFSVGVSGSAPFSYQWRKNTNPIPSATGATLALANLQTGDAASYDVIVSNAFGSRTSSAASLTVSAGLPYSAFNLYGFGQATTGGGVIEETHAGYRKVSTPLEFITALADRTGTVKVIEILNDLDLGYLEVPAAVRSLSIFRQHALPKLHPRLLQTGVSLIDIQNKTTGLTIFSANGATIRHATLNIKSSNNIIVRNLRFDEMWEWDEASKGDYDSNDWDFIDLGNAGTVFNIWIDHCTFTKAYDGISDIKKGSYNITFSWNKYVGDDGATNPNSFVRQQLAQLEIDRSSRPMYNFLRTNGFSIEDIATIIQGHDKTHLIGANSLDDENNNHTVTFHHQWHLNPWDRLPRLRGGNVHNYNLFVDAGTGRAAKLLRDTKANALTTALRNTLNNTYNFNPFLNGSISTEGAAILVEKSVYLDVITPLRNNQTDINNPIYTGKILALDTISRMTTNAGVSTTVRGNSTDAGNPMGPFQAAIIPFSWNLPGNALPYSAPMDDPAGLENIVIAGAGAGKLSWPKQNWLKTNYPAPPVITFASWAATQGLTGNNAAPDADYDGDGLSNGFEYATGSDAKHADPSASASFTSENGSLVFRFTRPLYVTGATYAVQTSTDLATWTPHPVEPTVESTTEALQSLIITLPAGQPKTFARLSVTLE